VGDWGKEIPAKLLEWALFGSLGYGIACLLEWRKRIHFAADDWRLQYLHIDSVGGWSYKETPTVSERTRGSGNQMRYLFTVRLFNKKSQAVGLHRISVQFTKGPWHRRRIVVEDKEPRYGEKQVRNGAVHHDDLSEMSLPSHDWAVERVIGYLDGAAQVSDADTVWFSAYSAEGKHFKWIVARLPGEIGAKP